MADTVDNLLMNDTTVNLDQEEPDVQMIRDSRSSNHKAAPATSIQNQVVEEKAIGDLMVYRIPLEDRISSS